MGSPRVGVGGFAAQPVGDLHWGGDRVGNVGQGTAHRPPASRAIVQSS